jgi:hypothetical protein
MVRPAWNAVCHLRGPDGSFKERRKLPVVAHNSGTALSAMSSQRVEGWFGPDDPNVIEIVRADEHASFVNYEPTVDTIASFLDELVESAGDPKPWLLLELENGENRDRPAHRCTVAGRGSESTSSTTIRADRCIVGPTQS